METIYMDNDTNYIIHKERSYYWKTAIGLQQVDGLVPSGYLLDIANARYDVYLRL